MPHVYKMPKVGIGDRVLWYQDCDKNIAPQMGLVMESSSVNCTIRLVNRTDMTQMRYDVRHVDDPIIERNVNVRPNGSWALHPETVMLLDVKDRLEKLEREHSLLSDVVTNPKGK